MNDYIDRVSSQNVVLRFNDMIYLIIICCRFYFIIFFLFYI